MLLRSKPRSKDNNVLQAQEQRLAEREAYIRELGTRHHLSGYDHSQLEREKVAEFISRLSDMKNKQNAETEDLQV